MRGISYQPIRVKTVSQARHGFALRSWLVVFWERPVASRTVVAGAVRAGRIVVRIGLIALALRLGTAAVCTARVIRGRR